MIFSAVDESLSTAAANAAVKSSKLIHDLLACKTEKPHDPY